MGSPIDELLEKYWNGETSVEEEKVIKDHFKRQPGLSAEARYFRQLQKQKDIKFEPARSYGNRKTWLSAAATVAVGVLTALLILNDAPKDPFAIDDPQEAFEATKKALMLIGGELNEGQNHAAGLAKINKAKEELEEKEEI